MVSRARFHQCRRKKVFRDETVERSWTVTTVQVCWEQYWWILFTIHEQWPTVSRAPFCQWCKKKFLEIKHFNGHEPFKCVGNSIDESRLPFMSGNQWYQGPLSISVDEKKIFKTFPPGKEDDRVEGEDEETWHRRNRASPRTRRRRNLRGWRQRVGRPVDSSS